MSATMRCTNTGKVPGPITVPGTATALVPGESAVVAAVDNTSEHFAHLRGSGLMTFETTSDLSVTELNYLDAITPGTVAANKAVIPTTGGLVDTLDITSPKIGGVAMTASAAELNFNDTATAGTAVASKTAVLGASKNLDILGLPVGGLKIGAAGAEVVVAATAAQIDQSILLDGADRAVKVERVALAAVDTAGGVFSWTAGAAVVVVGLVLDVTTQTSGACTLDCGPAANATTLNDTLIDGANPASAGTFNHTKHAGTNGLGSCHLGSTQYITGSVASGASAGIVGFAYISYFAV